MERYRCGVCGHVYDEEQGDPRAEIPPDTVFDEVLESWTCPTCGAEKSLFEQMPVGP